MNKNEQKKINKAILLNSLYLNRLSSKQSEDVSEVLRNLQYFKLKNKKDLLHNSLNERDEKTLTGSKFNEEGTLTNTNKYNVQVSLN